MQFAYMTPIPNFRTTGYYPLFLEMLVQPCSLLFLSVITLSACNFMSVSFAKEKLLVKDRHVFVEIAKNKRQHEAGLMNRKSLGENDGMLFIFERSGTQCMWMKNTTIPLSVAFFDEMGKVVNIEDMAPLTNDFHCGNRDVKYALEMNKGWFETAEVLPNDIVPAVLSAGRAN